MLSKNPPSHPKRRQTPSTPSAGGLKQRATPGSSRPGPPEAPGGAGVDSGFYVGKKTQKQRSLRDIPLGHLCYINNDKATENSSGDFWEIPGFELPLGSRLEAGCREFGLGFKDPSFEGFQDFGALP